MTKLFLFTSTYPFGKKETYIEEELEFLAKQFETIEIFPYYFDSKSNESRTVPINVKVNYPALPYSKIKRLAGLINICLTAPLFIKDFFRHGVYNSKERITMWAKTFIHTSYVRSSPSYKKINTHENIVCYFYWGSNWAECLPFLKKRKNNINIVRLHGGDCFLERSNGYLPLREQIYKKADILLPISFLLKRYLIDNYNIAENRIFVSRLGTKFYGKSPKKKVDSSFIVVSCSNIIPLKRLNLIIAELSVIKGMKITWHHFGDGLIFNSIKEYSKMMPSNIKAIFHGRLDKIEILEFYKKNYVDVFVNLSEHEGLPVSIMEAMSFSIPVIATNVGATSEIVNDENGYLIDCFFEANTVAKIIHKISSSSANLRLNSFSTWEKNYNVEEVFKNHIQKVIGF